MKTNGKTAARVIKHFKNPIFEIYIKETNILGVEAKQEMLYDKEEVGHIISNIQYLAGDKKYLVLVNSGPLASISYEGLKALAHHSSFSYAYAKAYVIHTIAQRLMANFYVRYFKPSVPIKFFRNENDAEVWLLRNFRHLCSHPAPVASEAGFAI